MGYTVRYGKDDSAVGLTDHRQKTIWIDKDLKGSVPMVLLHEILHALNRNREKCPVDPIPEEFRKLGDQAVHAWIFKFQGEILEKFNPPTWNGHDDTVMAHPYNIRKAFEKGGLQEALKYMNQNKIPDHL